MLDMENLKKGFVQKIIGSGDNAIYGLSFVIFISLFIGLICAFVWGEREQQGLVIGMISTCIAYVFGRQSGKRD